MWKRIIEVDRIALILHILLLTTLVILKGGGVIIVSWLWVFMPWLYSVAHFVCYTGLGMIWLSLLRFVGDE